VARLVGDRRGRGPTLTEAGQALLAEAVPVWRATHAGIERQMTGSARLVPALAEIAALGGAAEAASEAPADEAPAGG
jgi:DNA-binding transcriptional LysR family regulator